MHSLTTQLGILPDKALDAAQTLLDARLVSSTGGRYELQTAAGEFPTWAATAPAEGPRHGLLPSPPTGFQSPPLDWFRGVDLFGGTDATGLWAHAVLQMQRPDVAATTGNGEAIPAPRAKPQASYPAPPSATPNHPASLPPIPSPPAPGPK